MLQKNNEALLQCVEDLKNLRNIVLNDIGHADQAGPNQALQSSSQNNNSAGMTPQNANRENILKKALKCK